MSGQVTLPRWTRGATLAGLMALVVFLVLPLGLATPPAPCAPVRSGCIACHTERSMLEPLVRPLPALPAEGEG
ncbi:MAG: hypothetical protein QN159_12765 [Armatimonadota bacterium]|nr:hypothetical protein [Armatimonadota bacterium]